MKFKFIGLLAETPVHPGTGQNEGEIDLPVARESTTGHPFIAGSSLKGALLDKTQQQGGITKQELDAAKQALQQEEKNVEVPDDQVRKLARDKKTTPIFGKQDSAGAILVGDARLLLLPVRSLSSVYQWVTCPYVLERLQRDCRRAGLAGTPDSIPSVDDGKFLGAGKAGDVCFFEERELDWSDALPAGWAGFVAGFVFHPEAKARISRQMTIVADTVFDWFARNALPVQARNVLNDETKSSENLWYEEALPCDTLMYSIIAQRYDDGHQLRQLTDLIVKYPFLQSGGNETVGQGWFALQLYGDDHFNSFVERIVTNPPTELIGNV